MGNEGGKNGSKIEFNEFHFKVQGLYNDFAKIFGYNSYTDPSFPGYIKRKDNLKTICGKMLTEGGAMRCLECQATEQSIICMECYTKGKDKHNGHKLIFKANVSGSCDCGDPKNWSESGFCPDHPGCPKNMQEIKQYINQIFKEEEVIKIREIFSTLCAYINAMSIIYEDTGNSTIKYTIINEFKYFLTKIVFTNKALIYILSEYLLKPPKELNFPEGKKEEKKHKKKDPTKESKNKYISTKHQCLIINLDNEYNSILDDISFVPKKGSPESLSGKKHNCQCIVFLNLCKILHNDEDVEDFFFNFLCDFRIKNILGLYMLINYSKIYDKKILGLNAIFLQVMSDSFIEMLFSSKISDSFVKAVFDEYYDLIDNNLSKGVLRSTTIATFNHSIIYITMGTSLGRLFSKKFYIYQRLIDILALFHNTNVFNVNVNTIQPEGFSKDLIFNMQVILELADYFFSLLDFEDIEYNCRILHYFMDKIKKQTKEFGAITEDWIWMTDSSTTKNNLLGEHEFTYNISLYRGFSIFLNRYVFAHAVRHKIEIGRSLRQIFDNPMFIDDKEFVCKTIINDLFKFMAFKLGAEKGLFVYYGEDMKSYSKIYDIFPMFYNCDVTLLKHMLFLDENWKNFSFYNIVRSLKIERCLNLFGSFDDVYVKSQSYTKSLGIFPHLTPNDYEKYLPIIKDLFNFILYVLRNNSTMIHLLFRGIPTKRSRKIGFKLETEVYEMEKENICKILQHKIIHTILANGNSINHKDLINTIPEYYDILLGDGAVNKLIAELTDPNIFQTQKIYCLNNRSLKLMDLNVYYSSLDYAYSVGYIIDFKKDEISLFNTIDFPCLNLQKNFNQNCLKNFYKNEENLKFIMGLSFVLLDHYPNNVPNDVKELYLMKEDMQLVRKTFLLSLQKLISFTYLVKNKYLHENPSFAWAQKLSISLESISPTLKIALDECKCEDEIIKIGIKYLQDILHKENQDPSVPNMDLPQEEELFPPKTEKNTQKENKKKLLMEKMKNKFKNKQNAINEKFSRDISMLPKEDETSKLCVFCRKVVSSDNHEDFLESPFGSFCYIIKDNMLYNNNYFSNKKEYEKLIEGKAGRIPGVNSSFNKYFSAYNYDNNLKYKEKSKKNLRFIQCNHYIHENCYEEFMLQLFTGEIVNLFCPLCKQLFNEHFLSLNLFANSKDNKIYKLIEPIDLTKVEGLIEVAENEVGGFKEYKINLLKGDDLLTLVVSNLNFLIPKQELGQYKKIIIGVNFIIENLLSKFTGVLLGLNNFTNEDFNEFIFNLSDSLFMNLDLILNIDQVREQVSIWSNIILYLRVIYKGGQMNYLLGVLVLLKTINLLMDLNVDDVFLSWTDNKTLNDYFFILFSYAIYFGNYNYITFAKAMLFLCIPFIGLSCYLRKIFIDNNLVIYKQANIFNQKLLPENNPNLVDDVANSLLENTFFLTRLCQKIKLMRMISGDPFDENKESKEKEEPIHFPNELEYYEREFGFTFKNFITSPIIKEKIKEISRKYTDLIWRNTHRKHYPNISEVRLSPSLLNLGLPNNSVFIDLPDNLVELTQRYHSKVCLGCKKSSTNSLICLVCGRKVCNSLNCLFTPPGLRNMIISIKYHNIICGGDYNVVIEYKTGIVFFFYKCITVKPIINLYVNEFGDIAENDISTEFKLDLKALEKVKTIWNKISGYSAVVREQQTVTAEMEKVIGNEFINFENYDD